MKVLLVEDDKKIAAAVKRGLDAEGFTVDVSLDGEDGLWRATEYQLRPAHPRPDAARASTAADLPAAARAGQLDADPRAHRPGRA